MLRCPATPGTFRAECRAPRQLGSARPSKTARADFTITAGALTAAAAKMEPSNRATGELRSRRLRNITFAKQGLRCITQIVVAGAHADGRGG
ncbi:MAG: hypothetical protein QOI39_964 [Mycobacterium sp.]|nr:hypothetical protein [Mycobacterium sp.]